MFLLVGGDSEIGAQTMRHLGDSGLEVVATTRRRELVGSGRVFLDFERLDETLLPARIEAACIFVAVARLAACQSDPQGSRRINVTNTHRLTEELARRGAYTLFLSTNQVFDGSVANVPADAPHSPVSEYGRQKAETETAIKHMMAMGQPVGILRLAKVVSPGMALIKTWDAELRAGRPVRAFSDMTMAPTPTELVARAIALMLQARQPMIAQLTGPRDVTYAEIARYLAARAGAPEALVETASAYSSGMPKGATPANTTLDSSYFRDTHGLVVPDVLGVVDMTVRQ